MAGKKKGVAEFKREASNVPAIFVNERTEFGTKHTITNPLHVPPNIEIGWAYAPQKDDGRNLQEMYLRGWELVRPDEITDDINEAINEGKICFRGAIVSQMGETGVANSVGLMNYGLVLLFRPKETSEKYRGALFKRFGEKLVATASKLPGSEQPITDEQRKRTTLSELAKL